MLSYLPTGICCFTFSRNVSGNFQPIAIVCNFRSAMIGWVSGGQWQYGYYYAESIEGVSQNSGYAQNHGGSPRRGLLAYSTKLRLLRACGDARSKILVVWVVDILDNFHRKVSMCDRSLREDKRNPASEFNRGL